MDYVPDGRWESLTMLSAIEEMWSKVKSYLRKVSARSKKALIHAIGEAHENVTMQDAVGSPTHTGNPEML